jgi:uncharacterized membrane protein
MFCGNRNLYKKPPVQFWCLRNQDAFHSPLPRHAANPTQQNINAIPKLEHEALGRRTITERVSEIITSLVGNVGFLLAQLILITGWILVNLYAIPGLVRREVGEHISKSQQASLC